MLTSSSQDDTLVALVAGLVVIALVTAAVKALVDGAPNEEELGPVDDETPSSDRTDAVGFECAICGEFRLPILRSVERPGCSIPCANRPPPSEAA